MSEIPEDIFEAATEVARRWYHEEWEPAEFIQQQLVKYIAYALVAERERCANIAEGMPPSILAFWSRAGGPPGNGYRQLLPSDVAAAIRGGE